MMDSRLSFISLKTIYPLHADRFFDAGRGSEQSWCLFSPAIRGDSHAVKRRGVGVKSFQKLRNQPVICILLK